LLSAAQPAERSRGLTQFETCAPERFALNKSADMFCEHAVSPVEFASVRL
jgi:hypothetical protein